MFELTSPSNPAQPGTVRPADHGGKPQGSRIPMDGVADLAVGTRSGETVLMRAHQEAPCRILFPRAETGDLFQAVLVNIAGGLVGGDRIKQDIEARPHTNSLATTQAAEKVYRSIGGPVTVTTGICVGDDAWFEWVPQPTILFDGAYLERRTSIELAETATLMAGEVLLLGRHAYGERMTRGTLRDRWDVYRARRLIWSDRTLVKDWLDVRDNPSCFAGAQAMGLLIFAAPAAPSRLADARELLAESETPAAATVVADLIIVRWLGSSARALLRDYAAFWSAFRAIAGGLPARMPKIWQM